MPEDIKIMRKVSVAINITLDGYCDHTAGIVDEELHQYFNEVMESVDTTIMGRTTFQLMEDHWPKVAKTRQGTKAEIDFADHLERIEKVVVSTTLENVDWGTTRIVSRDIIDELHKMKQLPGKNILIGGPSLISYLAGNGLIDEFHLIIHPFILGEGIRLFKQDDIQLNLELISTKIFNSGVIATHYQVKKVE